MTQTRHKTSLSSPADLVAWIDRQAQAARKRGETRSGVVERAVRGWARRAAAKDIEEATIAYYQAMTFTEHEEDEAWSRLGEARLRSESRPSAVSQRPKAPRRRGRSSAAARG